MALEPGDSIQEGTCEQVGNFPFALLKDATDLQLRPGFFGYKLGLTDFKDDYINSFKTVDNPEQVPLIVCNEEEFAERNTPYIVKLGSPSQVWALKFGLRWNYQERANSRIFCLPGTLMKSGIGDIVDVVGDV